VQYGTIYVKLFKEYLHMATLKILHDKTLNTSPSHLIICRRYELLKMVQFFWPILYM